MKRIYNIEELIKLEEQRQKSAIKKGYVSAEDSEEWMTGFVKEAKRFWEQYDIATMMVLEIEELEDEEYALASFGDYYSDYKMVYMSCRGSSIRLITF